MKLEVIPITLREAHAFVEAHHRHHDPDRGARFAIGAARNDEIVAVAVVGRPKARMAADTWTAEVTRVCSVDGIIMALVDAFRVLRGEHVSEHASGACSLLYAACWRAAKAMGYRKLITYTLPEEGGASLRGAGWKRIGEAGGGSWSRKSRPRVDTHPTQVKLRWEAA